MNRLFQDSEGQIPKIQGKKLEELKVLFDIEEGENKGDVILFWLKSSKSWLRIFIDGSYCGIDEYFVDACEI